MNVLGLCAGAGGLELGIRIAVPGARGVAYVEREAHAAANLVARMEDGCLHHAPVWSDLATFDARGWRGVVDCVASGDPCQPNSVAGRGLGAADERFLIDQVLRIVAECGPDRLFRENVCGNADGQLGALVPALEGMGYRVAAGIFSAARPERATGASDCSLWPTAVAQDDNKSPEAHLAMKARMKGGPRNTVTSLQVMAKIWATPQARDHFPAHTPERVEKMKALGHGMRNLNDEVSQWRTPSDISKRGGSQDPAKRKAGGHAVNLEDQAEHWPPPITADDGRKVTPRSAQRQLCNVASVWPQSFARPDQPMPAGGRYSDTRRSLNPLFVEWLMGWPIGWTDCGQPVTGFSRWLQRSRGALSTLCTPMPTAQGDLFGA